VTAIKAKPFGYFYSEKLSYFPLLSLCDVIKVEPTVAGLKAGKDEVLQRAIQFIESEK